MKKIIIMALFSLSLFGCANYEDALLPTNDIVVENTLTDMIPTEAQPTSTPTKTSPTPTVPAMITPTPQAATIYPGKDIFTFDEGEPFWFTVDDNVMGGVSNSTVDVIGSGILSFSGTMSLDNNGGFSSVRSDWTPINLSDSDGVLLRVLGDGNVYRLRIRTADTGREISYNAIFETKPETWTVVYIPFANMVPTYRGFLIDVDALDPSSIGSFGFMISDKQPGEFSLLVDWIRAVSEQELRTLNAN
jgi:monofunctional biosynthetic peptidoglycan transglycosylase